MTADPYASYWARKQLRQGPVPNFPVARWWETTGLCDIERRYFDAVAEAATLLDVGAGDLRVKQKFERAGFRGRYDTLDVGEEYDHTYRDLKDVDTTYDAIICLDVIEHIPLSEGLGMLERLVELLEPGGVLIVQTPNARCVRHPLAWDMTHLQCYNIQDLWAYLTVMGCAVDGYRVLFAPERFGPLAATQHVLGAIVTTRLLGLDYADNIALIAREPAT